MKRSVRIAISALLYLLVFVGLTSSQASAAESSPNQALLERKYELLHRHLEKSKAARKAKSNVNTEAKESITAAENGLKAAGNAIKSGKLSEAAPLLDQAIKSYSKAVTFFATPSDRGEAQQNRFNELTVGVESFRLYVQQAVVKSKQDNPLDNNHLDSLLTLASYLGNNDNYGEANEVLDEAYQLTITAVSALKGGATIVYTLDFSTPADEFGYELDRYNGLLKLLKMIHPDELPPKLKWMEKNVTASRELYNQALANADAKRYDDAIKQVEEAAQKLTQVLRLMGLPIS